MFSPEWDKWGRGDKEKEDEEGISFTAEFSNRILFNACGEISRYRAELTRRINRGLGSEQKSLGNMRIYISLVHYW